MTTTAPDATRFSIAGVERETGIAKDTLRVWERRYGFPQPARDAFGERSYSRGDVQKLRIVKRLIDIGHRPGKLVMLDEAELIRMGEPRELRRRMAQRDAFSVEKRSSLKAHLGLLEQGQLEQLRRQLAQIQLQTGFARLVTDSLAPLAQMVSDAVLREQLPRYAQRVFTEMAQRMLNHAIGSMPEGSEQGGPRVLLASLGHDGSGLELLMIEALLALSGCRCISLGPDAAPGEVAQAAQAYGAQIVVLHCHEGGNPTEQLVLFERVRYLLADEQALWIQGCSKVVNQRMPKGIRPVYKLDALAAALADWSAQP